MGKVVKTVVIIVSLTALTALVVIATRKDTEFGILSAGRKWIEDMVGNVLSPEPQIEEYKSNESLMTESIVEESTEAVAIRVVDENGDTEIEAVAIIGDADEDENGYDDNMHVVTQTVGEGTALNGSTNVETTAAEQVEESLSKDYGIDIPTSYYDYIDLSLEDRIAIEKAMGEDYEPWLENLKSHKDDGYIIINADGSSAGEVE